MTTLEATKSIPSAHPAFAHHFPGDPVLPGAVLAELVVDAAAEAGWTVAAIESLKFTAAIRPGGTLRLLFQRQGASARFECVAAGTTVAAGKLRLAE